MYCHNLYIFYLLFLVHSITPFKALDSYKIDSGEFPFQSDGRTDVTKILTRWYVREDGTCQKFYYKGSGGNSNNFGTEHECLDHLSDLTNWETLDGCREGYLAVGPCSKSPETKYGYVASLNTCTSFNYGGCGGNNNRFKNENDCKKACEVDNANKAPNSFDCNLPPKYPIGDDVKISIVKSQDPTKTKCHYAIVDKVEERGIFPSFSKCLRTCYACSKSMPHQEINGAGTKVVKFYYHNTDKTCLPFVTYDNSGEFNPENNYFNTEEECMSYCPVDDDKIKEMMFQISKDICSLAAKPNESGSLTDLTKWYYDKNATPTGCKSMTHGGVGDMYGLFDSNDECNALCGSDQ